ncbi:restriction endonuclease [Bordetella genomosp. 1]|uniref:Restriction endonuclease n=1 Tax=Bordetella genomosp. 1 TaxID=1395607 RepID=A0A261SGA2_9BORD|nr:HNH endonuclease signature motif containing protein [Bordetella genomosp. 1]OZI36007.1 restriction endonuclease [Bordetella genomosp. 1]
MAGDWTDEELRASVEAYKYMLDRERQGLDTNKAAIYRKLAGKYGRTAKAFEYRMQNISAVYAEMSLAWLTGLKPAQHIGAEVKQRIGAMVLDTEPNLEALIPADPNSKYKHGEKPTWELCLDAVVDLGGSATRKQVREWILARHPNYNEKNLVALEMLSVNSKARTSYTTNAKPRLTNSGNRYDQLFKIKIAGVSTFELYVPELHGIWEIFPDPTSGNRHQLGIRQRSDPINTTASYLGTSDDATASFDPNSVVDARRKVVAEIYHRRGQSKFRNTLRGAYRDKCAVTGCDVLALLEAAHVHPYKGAHTNVASNGLLLRADIHTLFDLYLLTIDSFTMTILVAPSLAASDYGNLAGMPIRQPAEAGLRLSVAAIDWHRARCDWAAPPIEEDPGN